MLQPLNRGRDVALCHKLSLVPNIYYGREQWDCAYDSPEPVLFACVSWATSRENVSLGIFDQVTFKPACSATEASYNLETLDIASIHIILSKQWTTKVLIRLRGCAGWSAPLLFAYGIRHIFAWPGPVIHVPFSHQQAHLSLRMTKPTKWPVHPAKTQIRLGIHLIA